MNVVAQCNVYRRRGLFPNYFVIGGGRVGGALSTSRISTHTYGLIVSVRRGWDVQGCKRAALMVANFVMVVLCRADANSSRSRRNAEIAGQ